jgi:hypothetical protein
LLAPDRAEAEAEALGRAMLERASADLRALFTP